MRNAIRSRVCRSVWLAVLVLAPASLAGIPAALAAGTGSAPASKRGCPDCGAVSGFVSELSSGVPLANQQVLVRGADPSASPVAFATTDGTGRFDTGNVVPAGDWYVHSASPDHINVMHDGVRCLPVCDPAAASPITVTAGTTRIVNLELPRGGWLQGTISTPAPGTPVTLYLFDADTGALYTSVSTLGGHYTSPSTLPSGTYRVRSVNHDHLIDLAWPSAWCPAAQCDPALGDPVRVTEGQATPAIDFVLRQGSTLSGRITRWPEGTPVQTAVFFESAAGGIHIGAASDADGMYETRTGVPPGDWRGVVQPVDGRLGEVWNEQSCMACLASEGTPIQVADDPVHLTGLNFTLDLPARIEGRISNQETMAGIANARVTAFRDGGAAQPPVLTGADGSYAIEGLEPGTHRLLVEHDDYGSALYDSGPCAFCDPLDGMPITLLAGETRSGVDLALPSGASIGGTVRDAQGEPLQGFVLLLDPQFANLGYTATDSGGNYRFGSLAPGDYLVIWQASGHHGPTLFPGLGCNYFCEYGEDSIVRLAERERRDHIDITAVLGAHLVGRLTSESSGAPIAGARVTAITRQNLFVSSASTNADGRYRIGPIAPGEMLLYTSNTGAHIAEAWDDVPCGHGCATLGTPIPLAGGDEFTADFALATGGRIAGRVLDAGDGSPLQANIAILRADGVPRLYAYAGLNGEYLSTGLPTGTYFVRTGAFTGHIDQLFDRAACYWCMPAAGTPVEVTSGETRNGIDFRLERGPRLRGHMSEAGTAMPLSYYSLLLYDAQGRYVSSFQADVDGNWESPEGIASGTYFLRSFTFGRYRDELLGGLACTGHCDVRRGTPVEVADEDVDGLDFALDAVLHIDGFEYPLPY